MRITGAKKRLDAIFKLLEHTNEDREFLLKGTRDVILWSGKSIIAVHKGSLDEARTALEKASEHLADCQKKSGNNLDRYLTVCEQEFTEASALLAIVQDEEIPTDLSLGVSGEAYILGLLDCIGELKRLVLDRIREDRIDDALATFDAIGELFSLLYPFAGLDKVIKDARRKLDVDRMLVEDTRSVITQEMRRQEILDALRGIEK